MPEWTIDMTQRYTINGTQLAMLVNGCPNEEWVNEIALNVTQSPVCPKRAGPCMYFKKGLCCVIEDHQTDPNLMRECRMEFALKGYRESEKGLDRSCPTCEHAEKDFYEGCLRCIHYDTVRPDNWEPIHDRLAIEGDKKEE